MSDLRKFPLPYDARCVVYDGLRMLGVWDRGGYGMRFTLSEARRLFDLMSDWLVVDVDTPEAFNFFPSNGERRTLLPKSMPFSFGVVRFLPYLGIVSFIGPPNERGPSFPKEEAADLYLILDLWLEENGE